MASTYSNLKIQLMATGENSGTWGNVTNDNLGAAIEQALVETATVTFASANQTLTLTDTNARQNARALRLNLTGTTGGARDLIVPAIQKPYIVNNGTANIITVKVSGQTGVAVPAGKTMMVVNNGTDVVDAITHLSSLTLNAATPLGAASGGTGANTLTNNSIIIGNTTGAVKFVAPGTSGNVLTSNGTVWASQAFGTNVISQNNSNVTVTDAGTGKIEFTVDAVEIADFTTGAVVFNESGVNQDFRIEGDTNANLLVVDASADAIGIGTNAPATLLDIAANNTGLTGTNASNTLRFTDTDTSTANTQPLGKIEWYSVDATSSARVGAYILATAQGTAGGGNLEFATATNTGTVTEQMQLTGAGDLQFNSGYGSVATAYGCRAWVNFNGTSTVAIRESGNVSSITDNGTGDYTVNFTTAMPDANYSLSGFSSVSSASAVTALSGGTGFSQNTTACEVFVKTTGGFADGETVCFTIFR